MMWFRSRITNRKETRVRTHPIASSAAIGITILLLFCVREVNWSARARTLRMLGVKQLLRARKTSIQKGEFHIFCSKIIPFLSSCAKFDFAHAFACHFFTACAVSNVAQLDRKNNIRYSCVALVYPHSLCSGEKLRSCGNHLLCVFVS